MAAPRVNVSLASTHQRRLRRWTGASTVFLSLRYDPFRKSYPAYHLCWRVFNEQYHLLEKIDLIFFVTVKRRSAITGNFTYIQGTRNPGK